SNMLWSHLAFSAEKETHVGHYHLLRTIGNGTFARAKLAQHINTGKEVLIKTADKIQQTSSNLELCQKIKIMKALHHPNIVKLFQVMEYENTLNIVMEYASGGDMFYHLVIHGLMSEKEAQRKFHYCHNKGIVHRDLRTASLLLDEEMNIKLADFGFGTEFTTGNKLDIFCGIPPYSLTRVLFQGEKYDRPPVDVWSLGVILYFMVSASLPFGGKTLLKVLEGQYDIPFHMSTQCKIFIHDPRKRATLEEIPGHLWMKVGHKERLYVQPLPDYDDPWCIEVMVNMGYAQEEIHDSLLNQKYNDVMATYLLLGHNTSEMESHTSTLEPQAAVHCTNSHTSSSPHEVHPTTCAKPKQCSSTKPAIPTYDYYIHNSLNGLSNGHVPPAPGIQDSLSTAQPDLWTVCQGEKQPPMCFCGSSSAHTIDKSSGAPEGTSFSQRVLKLSSLNEEQVQEVPDQPNMPQAVTPASPFISSQGQQGATGSFFKIRRRYLVLCVSKRTRRYLRGEAKPHSLKFTWKMKIISSMEPKEMRQEICRVLDANGCEWDLTHKYKLLCLNGIPGQEDFIQWRMEVCTLPQQTLNGVKLKRISGTSEAFDSTASKFSRELVL
uniref:non-specific serine/threonine protein kinase n=1 Tax=Loxodonta africana TaxID=9785 RepID=G3U2B4_LOXAF